MRCADCEAGPVARCGRCAAALCAPHRPRRGRRCPDCEREWDDGRGTRRALQHLFAPPAFVLGGGLTFGLLVPVLFALPFTLGATVVVAFATSAGAIAARGACRLVESSARAQFLREHARALPEARLLLIRGRARR